ncbi:MAG: Hsp70 family protein [Xenococcaceae cyanobacterium]
MRTNCHRLSILLFCQLLLLDCRSRHNVFIGEVTLKLTISRPANEHRIECVFFVDRDGILHVLARDAHTDAPPVDEKFDHFYRLTQQEVDALLREAKTHQEEDAIISCLLQLQEEFKRLEGLDKKEGVFIEKNEQFGRRHRESQYD